MTLLHQIQIKLQTKDIAKTVTKLGYKASNTKVSQVLKDLLNAPNIACYLNKSYYDFRYNPRTLLLALCEVLDISKIDYLVTIEEYEDRKKRLKALKNPYIFVDTNFKRKNEPIIALSFIESKRRMKLDKEFFFDKSKSELDTYIAEIITSHYKKSSGKLPLWGNIRTYIYYDTNGKKTVYNSQGKIIEDDMIL